ncbi:hypothetical protein [Priestia megaterium]|uniref:Uncharacterized protein n=1 Tax=Priestia megaterium TaxID=1404 RepID=A0A6M6DJL4_PRIMG|nr:hypothetical protein [Priestia megaterium]QJX74740.1 hypothetical protein FDZ14_00545 [Priestia megaterium]
MNENNDNQLNKDDQLTPEDIKIEKYKKMIEKARKDKKARIAKEKRELRKKREHYLITLGADVQRMLEIKNMASKEDVENAKRKIGVLLAIKKTLNDNNIYTKEHILDLINGSEGGNNAR